MNIAIMLDTLSIGGAERQAILCVSELRKLGHSADLIHYHPSIEYSRMLDQLELNPIYVPSHGFVQRCRLLRQLFKQRKYDVVHGFKMAAEVYAAVAGSWAGVPRRFGSFRSIYAMDRKYCLLHFAVDKLLNGWVVNSRVGAESMARRTRISRKKIQILHNGVLEEMFSTPPATSEAKLKLGLAPETKAITMVARLEPGKNHRMLIDVASLVLEQTRAAQFLIVGKGSMDGALRNYAHERGVEGNVSFLGERSDVPEILAATDISVLTTNFEGMPNTIIEAMAAARPIVCTAYPGFEEILTHESNALVSPCGDAKPFAKNVLRLLGDETLRRRLADCARQHAYTNFSNRAMARNLEAIYLNPRRN